MAEGLDLYDDVLTTGAEMPVGPEDEVLQVQVRTQSDKDVTCRKNLLFLNWSNNNNLQKTQKRNDIQSFTYIFSFWGDKFTQTLPSFGLGQVSKNTLIGLYFKWM